MHKNYLCIYIYYMAFYKQVVLNYKYIYDIFNIYGLQYFIYLYIIIVLLKS